MEATEEAATAAVRGEAAEATAAAGAGAAAAARGVEMVTGSPRAVMAVMVAEVTAGLRRPAAAAMVGMEAEEVGGPQRPRHPRA